MLTENFTAIQDDIVTHAGGHTMASLVPSLHERVGSGNKTTYWLW